MKLTCPFVLASGSPRRKKLLEGIGLTFAVDESGIDETVDLTQVPADVVQDLAEKKARAVANRHPDALTLGADTIVVLDGEILNKPADEEEARGMLGLLSGRSHGVFTGICLLHPASGRRFTACRETQVEFSPLSDEEIRAYVATGSPLDKAGAYGIQDDLGALFIPRISGDYYNVVGLPLNLFYQLLREEFGDLLVSL